MISIIIPSYNHARYIGRCIESVLEQTHADWELIVIDDGSKDASNDIIASYRDKRITHLRQENQGAHNTINRGLGLAKGEFLAILNSDDEYYPQRLERCMAHFSANPADALVSTWIEIVDDESRTLGIKQAWANMEPWPVRNRDRSFAATDDYALNALMSNFVATTSNMVFRRELLEEIGGMRNLRFAHDWDFLLRVCSKYSCKNLEEPLLRYRIHQSNTISSNRQAMLFEICWIIAANIDLLSERLLQSHSMEGLVQGHVRLLESINFQGNDHVFWLLYWNINQMRKQGIVNPEEVYLGNSPVRDAILEYISV